MTPQWILIPCTKEDCRNGYQQWSKSGRQNFDILKKPCEAHR